MNAFLCHCALHVALVGAAPLASPGPKFLLNLVGAPILQSWGWMVQEERPQSETIFPPPQSTIPHRTLGPKHDSPLRTALRRARLASILTGACGVYCSVNVALIYLNELRSSAQTQDLYEFPFHMVEFWATFLFSLVDKQVLQLDPRQFRKAGAILPEAKPYLGNVEVSWWKRILRRGMQKKVGNAVIEGGLHGMQSSALPPVQKSGITRLKHFIKSLVGYKLSQAIANVNVCCSLSAALLISTSFLVSKLGLLKGDTLETVAHNFEYFSGLFMALITGMLLTSEPKAGVQQASCKSSSSTFARRSLWKLGTAAFRQRALALLSIVVVLTQLGLYNLLQPAWAGELFAHRLEFLSEIASSIGGAVVCWQYRAFCNRLVGNSSKDASLSGRKI
eukprot:gnl/MRDRNA2_/MRDRNA2_142538_c0_seq1.p1 gnl/MRDRNA2_/MRDRNA2_142538_c0~~gnl/MRDRNA2_/MRDRNA2_142538_c0_seq1.p1  ORF type:complete len:392 (-),score=41.01 gnl/MRDRNA2_/MRDRNA2_142538_c0_seq1:129-1304(-)